MNQLVNSTAPDKGAGLQLTIPLRNRAAQATQVRSEFEYRQAQLRILQLENQVRIEVRNAQLYEKAEVELDRAIGVLLDHAGIQIAEAERGQVTHAPNIPHVAERPVEQLKPTSSPQPQQ